MKRAILVLVVMLAILEYPFAQQGTSVENQPLLSQLGTATSPLVGCISSVKGTLPNKNQTVPAAIKPYVPETAFVRLILPLSNTDTLTIYELGNWGRKWEQDEAGHDGGELTDADTHFLVTREGHPVFQYALRKMETPKGHHDDWGVTAVAASAAHQCSNNLDITYIVVQSGNSGGFFFALNRLGDGYKLIPISDAYQGRLVLSTKNAGEVEVWTAVDRGVCDACAKPFMVKKLVLDGTQYRPISNHQTHRQHASFQNEPLVLKR